jgi:surfeit locus 1 family protein
MLVALLSLGTWQVQRLLWKQSLLEAVDTAERLPPTPLPANPLPFTRVVAQGSFAPATAAFYGAELRGSIGGARALAILERPGQPPVLVDRGWVPAPTGAAPPAPPSGPVSLEAYVRPAEPAGLFTPAPNRAAHRFYALDPAEIGAALGVPALAPYTLVVLGPPGTPDPARAMPRPANNHLSYAITWYSLAVALLAIFILYLRKAPRS